MEEQRDREGNIAGVAASATDGWKSTSPSGETWFPIVGIGASAGGLAAFEAFFSGMPPDVDSNMAFVLVQHLAPDHKSILADLVRQYTRMEVFEVEDGMRVQPNRAYIIPPNRDMALLDGALQLLEAAATGGRRPSIDFFFRSLALDQHERAICVILSGSGSDGVEGLRAIKAEGGMAMVQTPESAEYDPMPLSAIASGLVDYTLPPGEMPAQLIAYAARTRAPPVSTASTPTPKTEEAMNKIFILLRAHTSHDFSQYKQNTVARRIERRMAVHKIEHVEQYQRYLQETPLEIDRLFRDLLIGVTQFFRDKEAYGALERELPHLFAQKAEGALLRVWTTGCSTGEEAYSLAILLREQMEATAQLVKAQVFATDMDSRAIDSARLGRYPSSIAADVSSERLARFFRAEEGSYRIHKDIRDLVIFSEHDVIKDPPFSKLDLVSCRNLLIYLGPELQRRVIALFHYALNPNGLLFLGSSETTGDFAELFSPVDRKAKLYRRKEDALGLSPPMLGTVLPRLGATASTSAAGRASLSTSAGASESSLRKLTERALLGRAPAAALVTEHGELLYFHGDTGKYLAPSPGEARLSIFRMAREGLLEPITRALRTAAARGEAVYHPKVRLKTNGDFITIDLVVQPVSPGSAPDQAKLFLVAFEEVTAAAAVAAATQTEANLGHGHGSPESESDPRFAALLQELRNKDEYLRTTQELMQTSNEELRSSNEELQSTNEELQSTNEELETSKEELQSVNEELATVNAELQGKVSDLSRANDDMNNLLAGTGVGTIFVDHELCIRRFTPAATQLINLIRSDVGRPLSDIVYNLLGYNHLIVDVQEVLDTLTPKEVEVQTRSGACYLLRVRPYRTLENVIEGAVITFMEVTEQKRAQAALIEHESMRRMSAIMRDARDAITVQDLGGRILAWNQRAATLYGWSEAEALTMNIRSLIPDDRQDAALAVIQRLMHAEVLEPYRMQRRAKNSKLVEVSLTATALVNESGEVYAVFTTERELKESPIA